MKTPDQAKISRWEADIRRVHKGMAKTDVEKNFGVPSQTVASGEIELVAYQAEQIGNAIYSIRVASTDDLVTQCYLGFELCDPATTSKAPSRLSELLQLSLAVLLAVLLMLIYFCLHNR